MSRAPGPYSPPPGRRNNNPASGFQPGHSRPPQQQHFDPPPTSAYEDHNPPRDMRPDDRPYAPAEPRAHSFNQVTPYYDDTFEAGSARSWEDQQAYTHRLPPPPSDYDLGRKPRPAVGAHSRDGRYDDRRNDRYDDRRDDRYDDRRDDRYDDRRDDRYDERYSDISDNRYDNRRDDRHDPRYDDRYDDEYSDAGTYDSRDRSDRDRHRRRRSSSEESRDIALGRPSDAKKDALGGSEKDRGIAAKLIGGAGGALIGQTLGRGHKLETIAGAAVGAIAATAIEKQYEKRKGEKVVVRRSRDGSVVSSADPYVQPGRDSRDGRELARDDARPGLRERLRSLSRRGARSLSRGGAKEDRRRRSDSYDSIDSLRRETSR